MRVFLALFLTVLGWSSSFIFIRLGLESYSAIIITFGRYLLAAILAIFIYYYLPNKTKISFFVRIQALLCGMIGMGIYSFTTGLGEITVPASIAGFIIGLMPLFASLLATFLFKEPLSKRLIIGIGLSLAGLAIIAFSGHDEASFGLGMFWIVIATICSTAYTLIQKPVIKKMTPAEFVCHGLWGAALILGIIFWVHPGNVLQQFQQAKLSATLSILYQAIIPSLVAFFGWTYALARVNIAKAGIVLYTMPLVTALLAYLILQEKPTYIAVSGMLLAFLGSLIGSVKIPTRKALSVQVTSSPMEAEKIK